jgi:hypothetical protein
MEFCGILWARVLQPLNGIFVPVETMGRLRQDNAQAGVSSPPIPSPPLIPQCPPSPGVGASDPVDGQVPRSASARE